jgi:CHASE2 domain-containing sensor protein
MASLLSRFIPKGDAGHPRMFTILILILAALLLLGGGGARLIESYERFTDPASITAAALVMQGVPKDALPVTLLDVDDKTHDAWGRGQRTPHAALAQLIAMARGNRAAAIVLDFDLSAEDSAAPPDAGLAAELSSYPADAPLLLLARRISFTRAEGEGSAAAGTLATPYDGLVAGKPNIRWITTLNDVGGDRQVRRIRLWQSVCGDHAGVSYPSAALAAAALVLPASPRTDALDGFLAARANSECAGTASLPEPEWPAVRSASVVLPYLLPDRAEARSLFRIVREGRPTVVMRRIPASQLVRVEQGAASLAGEVDSDPFAGRVVLIGASHADTGDIYPTPLGSMPGVMILANSVVQAKAVVDATAMPKWLSNTVLLLLFLTFAYVARKLQGAPSILVIGLMSLAALFAVSRLFSFADGVTIIGVAIPGFALFKLFDSLVHIGMDIPHKGWRALLKK